MPKKLDKIAEIHYALRHGEDVAGLHRKHYFRSWFFVINVFNWRPTMTTKLVFGALVASVLALTLVACGGGGGSDPAPPKETIRPEVIATSVTPTPGATVPKRALVVTLPFTEALACFTGNQAFSDNGFTGQATCSGSVVTMKFDDAPLDAKQNVTVTLSKLTDLAGNAMVPFAWTYQLAVDLATVTLTATPTTVVAGSSATLAWATTNAVNCLASGGWNGSLASAGGSQTVTPTTTTTYGIECYNSANVSTEVVSTTVTVTPAPVKLEYTDMVVAIRPAMLNNLYGVDRTVSEVFLPLKTTIRPFYAVAIRLPRADNCLIEVRALDNTTFVRYNMLFNPKTFEMKMDTTGNQDTLQDKDYMVFNPADPLTHPLWETSAQTALGWYYTLMTDPFNVYFVDNAGVVTKLTNTTFAESGSIYSLWSFTCKAP